MCGSCHAGAASAIFRRHQLPFAKGWLMDRGRRTPGRMPSDRFRPPLPPVPPLRPGPSLRSRPCSCPPPCTPHMDAARPLPRQAHTVASTFDLRITFRATVTTHKINQMAPYGTSHGSTLLGDVHINAPMCAQVCRTVHHRAACSPYMCSRHPAARAAERAWGGTCGMFRPLNPKDHRRRARGRARPHCGRASSPAGMTGCRTTRPPSGGGRTNNRA